MGNNNDKSITSQHFSNIKKPKSSTLSIVSAQKSSLIQFFNPSEWLKVQDESSYQIWQNLTNLQIYDLFFMDSSLLKDRLELEKYEFRRIHSTHLVAPQCLLKAEPNMFLCSTPGSCFLILEHVDYRLKNIPRKLMLDQGLYVLLSAACGYNLLNSFYGPIMVNDYMIAFNCDGVCKVWISPNFQKNELGNEDDMRTIRRHNLNSQSGLLAHQQKDQQNLQNLLNHIRTNVKGKESEKTNQSKDLTSDDFRVLEMYMKKCVKNLVECVQRHMVISFTPQSLRSKLFECKSFFQIMNAIEAHYDQCSMSGNTFQKNSAGIGFNLSEETRSEAKPLDRIDFSRIIRDRPFEFYDKNTLLYRSAHHFNDNQNHSNSHGQMQRQKAGHLQNSMINQRVSPLEKNSNIQQPTLSRDNQASSHNKEESKNMQTLMNVQRQNILTNLKSKQNQQQQKQKRNKHNNNKITKIQIQQYKPKNKLRSTLSQDSMPFSLNSSATLSPRLQRPAFHERNVSNGPLHFQVNHNGALKTNGVQNNVGILNQESRTIINQHSHISISNGHIKIQPFPSFNDISANNITGSPKTTQLNSLHRHNPSLQYRQDFQPNRNQQQNPNFQQYKNNNLDRSAHQRLLSIDDNNASNQEIKVDLKKNSPRQFSELRNERDFSQNYLLKIESSKKQPVSDNFTKFQQQLGKSSQSSCIFQQKSGNFNQPKIESQSPRSFNSNSISPRRYIRFTQRQDGSIIDNLRSPQSSQVNVIDPQIINTNLSNIQKLNYSFRLKNQQNYYRNQHHFQRLEHSLYSKRQGSSESFPIPILPEPKRGLVQNNSGQLYQNSNSLSQLQQSDVVRVQFGSASINKELQSSLENQGDAQLKNVSLKTIISKEEHISVQNLNKSSDVGKNFNLSPKLSSNSPVKSGDSQYSSSALQPAQLSVFQEQASQGSLNVTQSHNQSNSESRKIGTASQIIEEEERYDEVHEMLGSSPMFRDNDKSHLNSSSSGNSKNMEQSESHNLKSGTENVETAQKSYKEIQEIVKEKYSHLFSQGSDRSSTHKRTVDYGASKNDLIMHSSGAYSFGSDQKITAKFGTNAVGLDNEDYNSGRSGVESEVQSGKFNSGYFGSRESGKARKITTIQSGKHDIAVNSLANEGKKRYDSGFLSGAESMNLNKFDPVPPLSIKKTNSFAEPELQRKHQQKKSQTLRSNEAKRVAQNIDSKYDIYILRSSDSSRKQLHAAPSISGNSQSNIHSSKYLHEIGQEKRHLKRELSSSNELDQLSRISTSKPYTKGEKLIYEKMRELLKM